MTLKIGQKWKNAAGTIRTIVESRGYAVTYYSGVNEDKTTTVFPWVFMEWIKKTGATK